MIFGKYTGSEGAVLLRLKRLLLEQPELLRDNAWIKSNLGEIYVRWSGDGRILFKYLETAAYKGEWNPYERVCRGLVLDTRTGEPVGVPFFKFFNYGQHGHPREGSHILEVQEKMDGSLGICYSFNGEWTIHTNGSFESEQSFVAQEMLKGLNMRYANAGWTLLFEIIYPENRIVVDYGQRRELVLLAVRSNREGEYHTAVELATLAASLGVRVCPSVSVTNLEALTDMLKHQSGVEHEGVITKWSDGSWWKMKGEDYMRLHKAKFSITRNTILDLLVHDRVDEFKATVPDEFHGEFDTILNELRTEAKARFDEVMSAWRGIRGRLCMLADRRSQAALILSETKEHSGYMFKLLDKKDPSVIYKDILSKL